MADDIKRRFYNPVTLIIEWAAPAYASSVGLIAWDGPTDEVEYDKVAGVEKAVLTADLESLSKPELVELAGRLGLDTNGNVKDLKERIAAYEAEPEPVIEQQLEDPALHGEPSPLGTQENDPQKEGQQ